MIYGLLERPMFLTLIIIIKKFIKSKLQLTCYNIFQTWLYWYII
jgi:hypothetical protein